MKVMALTAPMAPSIHAAFDPCSIESAKPKNKTIKKYVRIEFIERGSEARIKTRTKIEIEMKTWFGAPDTWATKEVSTFDRKELRK